MNQEKIGNFLKELRLEKGLTQTELADKFYTTSRSVSRWETGKSLPDLSILIDIAEFYEVDIGEIIDGERHSKESSTESKDIIKKVAEYSDDHIEETKKKNKMMFNLILILGGIGILLSIIPYILFAGEHSGILYGVLPHNVCSALVWITYILAIIFMMLMIVLALNDFKKDYINEVNLKKHKITNILIVILLALTALCLGLTSETYGPLYNIISPNIRNIIRYVCYFIYAISGIYMFIVSEKSIKAVKNRKAQNK